MAKYDWLLQWAMHFAQGDRSTAEDMVQDAFVRFALAQPDLSVVENEEAFLYTYLKYVHLAHLRRTQRYPFQQLSILEFDSIELGLRENPSADPIEVQDDLRRVVAYLGWRKEFTKSASTLILRFLHGYFPEEIMQVALMSRQAVDNGLKAAREEVKSYIADPGKLRILHHSAPPEVAPQYLSVPSEQFLTELRWLLFESCQRVCLSSEEFLELYETTELKPIKCEVLAHIVSCPRCLDRVNRHRGLSLLSERSSEDSLGQAQRSRPVSKVSSFSDPRRSFLSVRRRMQEVLEHRPKRLMIAVNGHVIAAQEVGAPLSKQEVEIRPDTQLELIEVVSEQGLCLLSLLITSTPPDAPPEQRRMMELSCGRSIEVLLRFTSIGPLVEVSYYDPSLSSAAAEVSETDAEEGSERILFEPVPKETDKNIPQPIWPRSSWWVRMSGYLLSMAERYMNPTMATAIIFAVASVICFLLSLRQPPRITANALLVRAEAWDSAQHSSVSPGVIYQKVQIKTPQRTLKRAIYRDAQGIRTPRHQQLGADDAQLRDKLASANVSWDEPLSATSYQDWHDHQHVRQDQITWAGKHLLKLTTTTPNGVVAQASLTVRDTDFHPVERTVVFRDAGTVEIAELNYDVMPWGAMNEDWFEPLSVTPSVSPKHNQPSLSVRLPRLLSDTELDEAELGARLILNQLHADSSERIEVSRTPLEVRVTGIVETADRKRQLEAALRQMAHVTPAVSTFQEAEAHPSISPEVTKITAESSVAHRSPLETFLLEKGESQDQVTTLSQQLLNAAVQVEQNSKALANLLQRFPSDAAMSEPARASLDELIEHHKVALVTALQQEEHDLTQIAASSARPSADAIGNLIADEQQNMNLCVELTSGVDQHARSAEAIVPELSVSIARLREVVLSVPTNPETPRTLSSLPRTPDKKH